MYEKGENYGDALYVGQKGRDQKHMNDRYKSALAQFSNKIDAGEVCAIRGISEFALRAMDNNSFYFVCVGGNHLYDYVKKDLYWLFAKVRPGSIISGDDYTPGG